MSRELKVLGYLRLSVLLELTIGLAVLIFTSILVNTLPAKDALDRTVHRTLSAAGLHLDVTVTPGRTGPDTITVVATDGRGQPQPIQRVSGSLDLPSHDISSLPVAFMTTRGGDEATAMTSFALSGAWQLTFEVQTSPIDATEFTTSFTIH